MPRSPFPISIALALLCAATLRGAGEGGAPGAPGAPSLLKQLDREFAAVFEKVAPAVVVIEAARKEDEDSADELQRFGMFFHDRDGEEPGRDALREKFRAPQESRSEGSGFLIRADGHILTNLHVVAEADKIEVRLRDGRRFPARVLAADEKTDIAVLKVEAQGLPVAELGDSEALKVGQLVCAIGTPFNQDYSFTCGWVSGKGRTNLLGATSKNILYEDYIQTDAFINPGNSGGPLFDVDGKVVGMNTLINGLGRGLAFAIPATMLREVSGQLIASGKVRRAWLGVRIETLNESALTRGRVPGVDHGVVVDTIEADAPAFKSELRPTDVITAVDGVAVGEARDLQRQILQKKVGQTVQLSVWRGGRTLEVPVTTGELPEDAKRVAAAIPGRPKEERREILGLKLAEHEGRGVNVAEVAPGSAAAKAGVQAGDVVMEVENRRVSAVEEAVGAIARSSGMALRKGILLNLERKGKRTYVVVEASEP